MSEHRARCFILGRVPSRENDLRVAILTEHGARLSVVAHGAQRSGRRFQGALMPLALYDARWTESRRGLRLDDATIVRAWPALLDDLRRNTAATVGTCVAGELAEGEPGDGASFLLLGELFDDLCRLPPSHAAGRLVRFTLESLAHTGSALALDRCVRCDTPAPEHLLVTVDPREGGVVCRGCGGGPYRLRAADRASLRATLLPGAVPMDPALLAVCAAVLRGVAEGVSAHLTRAAPLFTATAVTAPNPATKSPGA